MKKIFNILFISVVLLAGTSCKKYLDINQNPNQALTATPQLILPQAITATANNIYNYNTYGGQTVGYYANAGGVSGWGSIITYDYTTTNFQALWSNTYDNLYDYEYIIKDSEGKEENVYYNAIAKIMKAYNFQLLVDTYNDVPYSDAFQGNAALSVKYDKAEDIYKEITDLVDEAILSITSANEEVVIEVKPQEDPMFDGNMDKWLQFAQSLKLKLIVRAKGKVSFSNENFDSSIGFLEDDAIVNPGYEKTDGPSGSVQTLGKQNRFWAYWAYSAAGTAQGLGGQYIPTPYIVGFYDGTKLSDPDRGYAIYKNWSASGAPTNQLGYTGADAARGATPNHWFKGTNSSNFSQLGIFKGYNAGQPLMLAAEVYFTLAEAEVRGILSGNAKADFESGIVSSFKYLYKDAAGNIPADRDYAGDADLYLDDNASSPLVNFDLATTDEAKIEAIITQKYIASNMILGHEAWNDYRRTNYPKTMANPQGNEDYSFVSLASGATTPDRLPTRILYPESEFKYNSDNVIIVNPNSDKIFWAK